jgi:hypothetical protein
MDTTPCCSETVARAVTLDVFRTAGVELSDLRPDARPRLVEIAWHGKVADMSSTEGLAAAGKAMTRRAAERWHTAGLGGVVR